MDISENHHEIIMIDDGTDSKPRLQTPQTVDDYVVGYWFVIAIAVILRVSLSLVNREANDNHYEVVKLILAGRSGLTMADCHECFHPKLFYCVCAGVFQMFVVTGESSRIVFGQLLNSALGLITLGLVFLALNATSLRSKWRFWTFALVAIHRDQRSVLQRQHCNPVCDGVDFLNAEAAQVSVGLAFDRYTIDVVVCSDD